MAQEKKHNNANSVRRDKEDMDLRQGGSHQVLVGRGRERAFTGTEIRYQKKP